MKTRTYRAAIVGVGKGGEGRAGFHSIGYAHAGAYQKHPRFELAGACDLNAENLAGFAKTFAVSAAHPELREMLQAARPDVVSICTYAGSHRAILEQCIEEGVKSIWCEKPLALTMDDAQAMLAAADRAGVKVAVNHLRRHMPSFRKARDLIRNGAVGDVSIVFSSIQDWDLMEWGTHWLDMMRFFMDDQPVRWVMGQARVSGGRVGYGHVMEQHAIAYFMFENGTRGFLDGGVGIPGLEPYSIRVSGNTGFLDVSQSRVTLSNSEGVREFPAEDSWEQVWQLVLDDFSAWIDGGPESQTSLRNSVLSTELYLAAYESAKIGNRVDLPLGLQSTFPLDDIAKRQSIP